MEHTATAPLRRQLEDRRARLSASIAAEGPDADLVRLLKQVDSALGRIGTDDYAVCVVCQEHVSEEDLRLNPLMEYCLCGLTPEQQNALQNDLGLARRIQAALLPDPDLAAAGWEAYYRYEPAGVVSGDYCDLWVSPDDPDTMYFAVGDVSGKGVAASLLMAHLQAAFRALLGARVPLADLVARVNRQLLEASIPTHYATLACGRARADGRVELVNAGHCPPLIARGTGVDRVGPTGFPIGLLSEKPYEVTSLELAQGDALVLYTDGLTEARRPDGEEYGEQRVERLLAQRSTAGAPRHIVQAVRGDLAGFLGDSARTDDLTLLALRRAQAA
jgi:sigma-B regulation protein RsbU (phosphoserine phosphatase)